MTYLSEVLADAPSVLWLLNEAAGAASAVDSSGHGKTGTKGTSVTFGAAGSGLISGYPTAATFAGSATTENLLQSAITPLADNAAYSLEAWTKTTISGLGRWAIGDIGSTAGTNRGAISIPTASGWGSMQVYNTSSTNFAASSTGTLVNDGARHHIVGTFASGMVRTYVDGVLRGGPTAVTGTIRALQALRLGGASNGSSAVFNGVMAGAALYPVELSAARVTAHYNAGIAPATRYIRTVGSAAPVQMKQPDDSWWLMESKG